jgi:serine/threonine-protein kinase
MGKRREVITTGQRFAGYELLELVGHGSSGAIYKAQDIRLQRPVAMRIVAADIASDPLTRARLNRESTLLASVDHPNVPPIYEAGEYQGRLFIASRWVDGISLAEMVRQSGSLKPSRAVRIANQIAAALQAAHALGISHRNVKPSSVLVTPNADHVYLTDFGLARRSDEMTGLTVQQDLVEALDYVAPEYISGGQSDARADIYGLGCVLYFSLTAEVPYPRQGAAAKMYAQQSAPPPSPRARNPGVPEPLDAVDRRAMAKNPDERQQTAAEFAFEAAAAVDLSLPMWASRMPEDGHQPPAHLQSRAGEGAAARVSAGSDGGGSPVAASAEVDEGRAAARAPVKPVDGAGAGSSEGEDAPDSPAPALTAPASSDAGEGEFHAPRYYRNHRQPMARLVLWILMIVVFLAAPAALVIALVH